MAWSLRNPCCGRGLAAAAAVALALLALGLPLAIGDEEDAALGGDAGSVYEDGGPDGPPLVCFIVRTYWAHGDQWGDRSLRHLVSSLQNQTDPR